MTLDKAKELLRVQADFGGFYNANSVKPILAEVMREHGPAAVGRLIRELNLDRVFNFEPGMRFEGGWVAKKMNAEVFLIFINGAASSHRLFLSLHKQRACGRGYTNLREEYKCLPA